MLALFSGSYRKPAMVRTGAVGTITSNARGYQLSGFNDNTYAYLDAGKTGGKWYWEQVVAFQVLPGVTPSPSVPRAFAGYNLTNAGIYTLNGTNVPWNQFDSVPAWGAGASSPGDIYGLALDVGAKTLDVYLNNVLGAHYDLTTIGSSAIYAMCGFQGSPTSEVQLGPGRTSYPPPSGYSYL